MGNHAGQREVPQTQHFCSQGDVKEDFEKEWQTLELNTEGQWEGSLGKDAHLCTAHTLSGSVNFHLNSKWNACSANQPPTRNLQVSTRSAPMFSLTPRSPSNANSYFIFMEAFPNTKHWHICHKILWGQRCNSIMWLNQFKWLMYKDLRMPSGFQLRANNCSIIS